MEETIMNKPLAFLILALAFFFYPFRLLAQDLEIPNVITPNGDRINDKFVIQDLPGNSSLLILDKNGLLIFESENYENNWYGKDMNGFQVNQDTYWYFLKLPSGEMHKGYIFVKRN
jgi:gliding motility-associated-like protein